MISVVPFGNASTRYFVSPAVQWFEVRHAGRVRPANPLADPLDVGTWTSPPVPIAPIAWSFFDPADSAAAAVWFGGVRGTLPQQIAEYVQIDRNGNLLCDLPGVFGDIPAALPPLTARAMWVYPGWFTSY